MSSPQTTPMEIQNPKSKIQNWRQRLKPVAVRLMAYTTINIGPRCTLGSTIVFDSDFHPLDPAQRHDPAALVACAPIQIGTNVWLGGQSAVLKGVTVGDNSVVAFRAVASSAV